MNIYDLSSEWLEIQDQLRRDEGEPSGELADALELNEADFLRKANNYCRLIGNLSAEARGLKQRADRLYAMYKSRQRRVEWLKANLKEAMEMREMERLPLDVEFTPRIQRNAQPSVRVEVPVNVPDELWRRPEPELNKTEALKWVREQGERMPRPGETVFIGPLSVTLGTHLRI